MNPSARQSGFGSRGSSVWNFFSRTPSTGSINTNASAYSIYGNHDNTDISALKTEVLALEVIIKSFLNI